MARTTDQPRIHIVSVRVNNEEMETLEELARKTKKNVSEILREALYSRVLRATAA